MIDVLDSRVKAPAACAHAFFAVALAALTLMPRTAFSEACANTSDAAATAELGIKASPLNLERFTSLRETFAEKIRKGEEISPKSPMLESLEGRLALLEASSSVNAHGLLSLERTLARAEAGEAAAVDARDKLIEIAEALTFKSDVRVVRLFPPRLSLESGMSPRELAKLTEVLYGLSLASGALNSQVPAVQESGSRLFGALGRRTARVISKVLRERVETELVNNSMEVAFERLGLMRDASVRERLNNFRERNAGAIASAIGLATNVPFMWAFGTSIPLYIPKVATIRSRQLNEATVAQSQKLLADGVPFAEHWELTQKAWQKDFGVLPEAEFGNRWARRLHGAFMATMLGHFVLANHTLLSNHWTIAHTTHADLVQLDRETFNSQRVRNELFQGWYEAYTKPDQRVQNWVETNVTDADRAVGQLPVNVPKGDEMSWRAARATEMRKSLEDRWRTTTAANPELKVGDTYVKRYIREFVKTYVEKPDEALQLK